MKKRFILLFLFFASVASAQNRLHFHSDLFLRYDRQEFPQTPAPRDDVDRYRIRWRPSLLFDLNPALELGIEGEVNWIDESDEDVKPPRFPEFHTPLIDRDNFKRDAVVLSRAFLKYSPNSNLQIVGGKFDQPFLLSELVWDSDLRPNGAALAASYESEQQTVKITARVGDFYATQYLHDRTNVLAAQGVFQATAGVARFTGAVSYLDFNVDELDPVLIRTNTRNGNSLANDYNLVDFIGRARFNFGFPLTAQIDYVKNTAADTFLAAGIGNGDSGYLADVVAGKLDNPGNFQIGYAYHHVESDAVFAAYNIDDWWFPTRGEGSRIHGAVKIVPQLIVDVSYLVQTFIGQDPEFKRLLVTAQINWP